jgi:hypothetical protein
VVAEGLIAEICGLDLDFGEIDACWALAASAIGAAAPANAAVIIYFMTDVLAR